MKAIIGQTKLVSQLSDYSLATLPPALLILGPRGGGKTFIIERLAKKLGLQLISLTSQTTNEDLIEYTQCYETRLYHLDLVGISTKAQNKFLKFIEEPGPRVKVILEAESEVGILPTILNRCYKFALEPYSIEELKSFSWAPRLADSLVYRFCSTPGQLLELAETDCFKGLYSLCIGILTQFPAMAEHEYPRAMSICTKIASKKPEIRKFDLNLFLNMLAYVSFEQYKTTKNEFCFKVYQETVQQKQRILNKSVAKDAFMLTFLTSLWRLRINDAI